MRTFIFFLISTLACIGCTINDIEEPQADIDDSVEFYADLSALDFDTKTFVDDNLQMRWNYDDRISIFTSTYNQQYIFKGKTGDVAGNFAKVKDGKFSTGNPIDRNYAVFPYNNETKISEEGEVTLTLPCVQIYADGTFGQESNTMVAATSSEKDYSLKFKNLCGFLVVKIYGEASISYIELVADGAEKISGKARIPLDPTEAPKLKFEEDSQNFIKLDCGCGTQLNAARESSTEFWFVVPPVTFNKGFSLKIYDTEGNIMIKNTSKHYSITRNIVNRMEPFEFCPLKVVDLSSDQTANCYIVSDKRAYRFNASIKGAGGDEIKGVSEARVLWESFGTDIEPTVGDVVRNVSYSDGYIYFTAVEDGNAVIAAEDSDGNILWSWHIWNCNGFDPIATSQEYNNGAGTMMDRNIGATSSTPGDVRALGLMYQWGRKDPFLGGSKIWFPEYNNETQAASTLSWPSSVNVKDVEQGQNSLNYSIQHPTTFIFNESYPSDWFISSVSTQGDNLWSSHKTVYDPCPPGWRVPDGGWSGVWNTALGIYSLGFDDDSRWDNNNHGINLGGGSDSSLGASPVIWYPANGYINEDGDGLYSVGYCGYNWSGTSYPKEGNISWDFMSSKSENYFDCGTSATYRGYASSVRCLSESSAPIIPVSTVEINITEASIRPNETIQLNACAYPLDANVRALKWYTGDFNVATVSQDGFVTAVGPGETNITVRSYNSVKAVCTITVPEDVEYDPNASNCYIAPSEGTYIIKPVKGNTTTSIGDVSCVEVLWESYGSTEVPNVGDIISEVEYKDGKIWYSTTGRHGNAVIAAKNAAGEILWSWHIWCTDQPKEQVYNNDAGTMLDRNLGAISAEPGSDASLGLLYQWGRKDPFLGFTREYSKVSSTNSWPDAQDKDNTTGTIPYTISHPMTFISAGDDWYYSGNTGETDNTRWKTSDKEKGIYDPCPAGWRVPNGGYESVWAKALGTSSTVTDKNLWDKDNCGINFGISSSCPLGKEATIWYPFTCMMYRGKCYLGGYYWTCTPGTQYYYAYTLLIASDLVANPACQDGLRGDGYPIRCQKIVSK